VQFQRDKEGVVSSQGASPRDLVVKHEILLAELYTMIWECRGVERCSARLEVV